MSNVSAICPFCKRTNAVEKNSFGVSAYGLNKVECSHCSKSWEENLVETGSLAKSAPSELAVLRVQIRAQMEELTKRINGLLETRQAAARLARFNPAGVEKSDLVAQELNKALSNGKPVTFQPEGGGSARFQTVESVASGVRTAPGGRFVPDGFEKNATAEEELKKALARPMRIG
jgi:transposase-like protein